MKMESHITQRELVNISSQEEKVKVSEKLSYGVGALGKDFYMGLITIYLLVYFTDVAGISAAAGGMILLVARIWDAINDPIMGVIVDKTKSRWGKFRPYILFTPIVLGISSVALFTVPNFSNIGLFIYFLIVYMIWGMAFTAYDVPIMSLAPAITKNTHERTGLLASSKIGRPSSRERE